MSEQVVCGPDLVRTLYRSISSCSDHHSEIAIDQIHISTSADSAILEAAHKKKVVILTGNPGDGKTHLIRKVQKDFPEHLRKMKDSVRPDANECTEEEIIGAINRSIERKSALIVAINEGILLELCERNRERCPHWAPAIASQILQPYLYGDEQPKGHEQIIILDLNLRNNLNSQATRAALEKVIGLIEMNPENGQGLLPNVSALKQPEIQDRLLLLLDFVGRTGFHATMRDVLGFLAFIITAGEIQPRENGKGRPAEHYWTNAFEGGQGPLFDEVRRFDPLYQPNPFLDDTLYLCQDVADDWIVPNPDEVPQPQNESDYRQRKRRAFFEHRQGKGIVRAERDIVDREFGRLLQSGRDPQEHAVRLLNNFFKTDGESDALQLWVYHQYSVRSIRYLVSRQSIRTTDLRVAAPRLPKGLDVAFPGHVPDHVILHHREQSLADGLPVDRRLIRMLLEGDRAVGTGSRSLEALSKIAAFYDRLRSRAQSQERVKILRLDTQSVTQVGVDVKAKAYFD